MPGTCDLQNLKVYMFFYITPKIKLFQLGFPKKHQAIPMLQEHFLPWAMGYSVPTLCLKKTENFLIRYIRCLKYYSEHCHHDTENYTTQTWQEAKDIRAKSVNLLLYITQWYILIRKYPASLEYKAHLSWNKVSVYTII